MADRARAIVAGAPLAAAMLAAAMLNPLAAFPDRRTSLVAASLGALKRRVVSVGRGESVAYSAAVDGHDLRGDLHVPRATAARQPGDTPRRVLPANDRAGATRLPRPPAPRRRRRS